MNEKYECLCGNDKFRILAGSIICSACTLEYEYHMGKIPLPREFNNKERRSMLSAECRKQLDGVR